MLLLKAAKRLEAVDPKVARETYLTACAPPTWLDKEAWRWRSAAPSEPSPKLRAVPDPSTRCLTPSPC
jgi:hypothetical protein